MNSDWTIQLDQNKAIESTFLSHLIRLPNLLHDCFDVTFTEKKGLSWSFLTAIYLFVIFQGFFQTYSSYTDSDYVMLPLSRQCRMKAVFSTGCQVSPPTSPVLLYWSPGSSHTLSRQEELVPGKDQRKAADGHAHQTSRRILFKTRRSKSILVDLNMRTKCCLISAATPIFEPWICQLKLLR